MKVTLFTSNQPRHVALINRLAEVCDLTAYVETTTGASTGYHISYDSNEKCEYFGWVGQAEAAVFPREFISGAKVEARKMGDLPSRVPQADRFIVSGASWIKGLLCDQLIEGKAVNVHAGIAPQYRGSSCNFWALYDGNPEFVGATTHMLTKGLDNGDICWLSRPDKPIDNPFEFTMRAVKAAHDDLVDWVSTGAAPQRTYKQDLADEIRYTKAVDFTDEICGEYVRLLKEGVYS